MKNPYMLVCSKLKSLVAAGFLVLLPFSLAAQVSVAGWPVTHFDNARTNFNPNEVVLGASNVGKLTGLWSFPACGAAVEPPAVANGVAYVTANCRFGMYSYSLTLYAVNARTGALLWQRPLGVTHSNCEGTYPPGVSGGTVYVGSCYGMSAINAATGAVLWQNTAVGPALDAFLANGVAVAGGMVYFTVNFKVYALNAATGAVVWSFNSLYGTYSSPAVANGITYVAGSFGPIYALDAATGTVLWTSTLNPGQVLSSPTIANDLLYVPAAFSGGLYALDAATGTLRWMALTPFNVWATPGVAYGKSYVAIHGHDEGPRNTYALDAATGAVVWQVPNIGGIDSVAVANGVVYAVNDGDGNIHAFDATTGAALTTFGGGRVGSEPVVVNGMVYFIGSDGAVHAYGRSGL